MDISETNNQRRRRPVSLTIRADIMEEAKALDLNASRAAETGIAAAVTAAKQEQWLQAGRKALDAHNARVADMGSLLKPSWAAD
jgi:antitoxin CcdA